LLLSGNRTREVAWLRAGLRSVLYSSCGGISGSPPQDAV
jgi:hypothetical protein